MAYKPSESRYDKGGRVLYLEYASPTRRPARVKRIYLPGEREHLSAAEWRRSGIPVSRAVVAELRRLGAPLGVELRTV